MLGAKLHADEIEVDRPLVDRLIRAQFPQWAGLPIVRVDSAGTDNAIYRLGPDMAVRLPRHPRAAPQIDKEQRWLPRLASQLPVAVPVPLGAGEPAEDYPWPWSIRRWLDGASALAAPVGDQHRLALDLASFITALQAIDSVGGPAPGPHNFGRGVPLAERNARVRAAIASLGGVVDTDAATEAWSAALRAPAWRGPPVWLHGDLLPGNLLVHQGRLSGVIDFGGLAVGDPACDLFPAWTLLDGEARGVFREALAVDDATWERGRGWALSMGLIVLPYYRDTNPTLVGVARWAIDEVLGA